MAGIEGFEPPIAESKSDVLPLDDIPLHTLLIIKRKHYIKNYKKSKLILLFFKVYIIIKA